MLLSFGQPAAGEAESGGVVDDINRLLQNLALKCAKSEGIRDYFYIGVIGYGGKVTSALGGALAGQPLVPVSTLANNPSGSSSGRARWMTAPADW